MPRLFTETPDGEDLLHVYSRGRFGWRVFGDDADRDRFIQLLIAFAGAESGGGVRVISCCLMSTHFHLILWEQTPGAIAKLMQKLLAAYVRWFNARHGRRGGLFDGPYRRKPIRDVKQLRWTIAYVHDNHPDGVDYRYSSHQWYLMGADSAPGWVDVRTGLNAFGGPEPYLKYLARRAERAALNREFF